MPNIHTLQKQSEIGPWTPKCEYKKAQRGTITAENYFVDLVTLRNKRTIQQKIVEFMILKLFSKQSIFSLMDILFKDMREDYRIYEQDHEDHNEHNHTLEAEEMDEESIDHKGDHSHSKDHSHNKMHSQTIGHKSHNEAEEEPEEDGTDPIFGVNIEDYMSIKGTLTIERIKDIVGEIMSSCAGKMRFEILEVIMKGVIFENKKLRESFMQEILNSDQNTTYKTCLEREMNLNELHCRSYFADKDHVFEDLIHERVIEYS